VVAAVVPASSLRRDIDVTSRLSIVSSLGIFVRFVVVIANVERIALVGRAAPGWLELLQQLLGL
jgi:hypothetical protein